MADLDVEVSVIVAVHNGAATLAQCIESVLAQTGCTVELIVVDAMSDDGTQEIVESFGTAISTYIRESDRGIYDAWNKALATARGEWCAFLGADDYYLDSTSVQRLLSCARQSGDVPAFVFGGILRIGGQADYLVHPDPLDPLRFIRCGHMLPHPGSLHHTELLREIGGFDASFKIAGDMDAVLRLLKVGKALRLDQAVTAMRVGGVSNDMRRNRRRHAERWRILSREIGRFRAVPLVLGPMILEQAGDVVERGLRFFLGPVRGNRATLRLRRILGRAPRLNDATGKRSYSGTLTQSEV